MHIPLARNNRMNIFSLNTVITATYDTTRRGFFEGKMKRPSHRRKEHKYNRGEAISTDIMGPLNIPGMLTNFKRYFISLLELQTRYAYVQPLTSRAETQGIIDTFLTKMEQTFRKTTNWIIYRTTQRSTCRQ